MPSSVSESPVQAIPDLVAALDAVRSALLALEVVDGVAEHEQTLFEEARAVRGGERKRSQVVAHRARGKALDRLIDQSRAALTLSRLDVPPPVEQVAVVHGRVTGKGSGVKNVTVGAVDADGRTLAEGTTDERGQYVLEIPGKEPVAVRLEVRKGRNVLARDKRAMSLTPGLVAFREIETGRGKSHGPGGERRPDADDL